MAIYKTPDFMRLPDCASLTEMGRCGVLTVSKCLGEKCPFKVSQEEYFHEIKSVYKRLASLNSLTQRRIAEKYYGGRMPWIKNQLYNKDKEYREIFLKEYM